MERNQVRTVAVGCLSLLLLAAAVGWAQGPDDVLVYSRFKLDQKFKTIGRISNTGSAGEVTLLFICPGDSDGFCPVLRNTFELGRDETRVFNVGDLDPPCREGYFIAVGDGQFIGSYEIFKGKVGKVRESDNAIPLSGLEFPRVLASDVRGTAGQDGSRLILIDILAADALFGETEEPIPSQPLEITGIRGNGNVTFTFDHEFTCYESVKLEELNSNFRRSNLGEYGSIVVRGPEPEAEIPTFILGALAETGKGSQSIRPMFDATPPTTEEVE